MKRGNFRSKKRSTSDANTRNLHQSQSSNRNLNAPEIGSSSSSMENPRFKDACERIKVNMERVIENNNIENSSSEDELESSEIIQKTFKKYDGDSHMDTQVIRELLQQSLTSGSIVCLICIATVKRNDPIWSCELCSCMFHVTCILKWAKDSMFHQSNNAQPNDTLKEKTWCCPQCRQEYGAADSPSKYFCFCHKVENPESDPWILPHSCGQTCGRQLQPSCGHSCLLLCHPGPCPPCPITVQAQCYCGKSRPQPKRCGNKLWSCNKPCKKLLLCKQHYCEEPCHGGDCKPCLLQSLQSCLCSSENRLRPCSDHSWQCKKKCVKTLDCGHHVCELVCHEGQCPSCPKSGLRTCPCAKKYEQLPCTEEVMPCGDTCGKLLQCGVHRCVERCHFGDCGNCLQMRLMKCRCGQNEKSVPCCKEFLCDTKCKNKRDCAKHNCNRKCCAGNCPPCEAPCGKSLNCGSHKCQSRCHLGPCFPCRETAEIKCFCGTTKKSVFCGLRRSAPPPLCLIDCKHAPDCHHKQRHKHPCHFGKCPQCRTICGKIHDCGHSCPTMCHTAVLTKVEVKKKKDGPWDLVNAFKMELIEKPCPPCVIPVEFTCRGKHVTYSFPCHEANPWSCGRICARRLHCGNHKCEMQCHDVESTAAAEIQSNQCEPCVQQCEKPRPLDCTHSCYKRCHPGACDPCREMIKTRCHCSISTLYVNCHTWTHADEIQKRELKCCQNTCPKQLSCGHRCPLLCHVGPCADRSTCKKKGTVRCSCKRIKKDVPCVSMIEILECNDECLALQEKKQAEQMAQQEEDARQAELKQKQELEEYRRKTERKKKKAKKEPQKVIIEQHFLKKYWFLVTLMIFVSILIPVLYYNV